MKPEKPFIKQGASSPLKSRCETFTLTILGKQYRVLDFERLPTMRVDTAKDDPSEIDLRYAWKFVASEDDESDLYEIIVRVSVSRRFATDYVPERIEYCHECSSPSGDRAAVPPYSVYFAGGWLFKPSITDVWNDRLPSYSIRLLTVKERMRFFGHETHVRDTDDKKKYKTISEAAEYMHRDEKTIRDWINRKPAVLQNVTKSGRIVLIPQTDLDGLPSKYKGRAKPPKIRKSVVNRKPAGTRRK